MSPAGRERVQGMAEGTRGWREEVKLGNPKPPSGCLRCGSYGTGGLPGRAPWGLCVWEEQTGGMRVVSLCHCTWLTPARRSLGCSFHRAKGHQGPCQKDTRARAEGFLSGSVPILLGSQWEKAAVSMSLRSNISRE